MTKQYTVSRPSGTTLPRKEAFILNGFKPFNALHPFRYFKAVKKDKTLDLQWDTTPFIFVYTISHF